MPAPSPARLALLAGALTFAGLGCGADRCPLGTVAVGGQCVPLDPDGGPIGRLDAGHPPDAEAHPDADTPLDAAPGLDGGTPSPDAGTPTPDSGLPRPDSGTGDGPGLLIRGAAVLPMNGQGPFTPGEVHVEDDRVSCVGPVGACAALAQSAVVLETDGIVLPGLVDAHNHVAYNWLREWEPGRLWSDAVQWRGSTAYRDYVTPYRENSGVAPSFCAMVQWGKVRALVNGVTTIFGTPQPRTCYRWLVRNAELTSGYNGWTTDKMRSNTLGIGTVSDAQAATLIADMDAGNVTAYMIHLAEGLSQRAFDEYTLLVDKGLLRAQTVIIHGTALAPADFDDVAVAGAKLVWSPSSNMVLYGDTTNVGAAAAAGVSISIAPDWTPSGMDDSLTELRYARALADERWPGTFSSEDYVAMVTRVAAEQMAVDAYVGTLEPGKYADVLVLAGNAQDPYRSVIEARPQDIRLVVLGGMPSFGEPALVEGHRATPPKCFPLSVCGTERVVCWQDTPDGPVSPESIAAVIDGFYPEGPQPLFDCEN